MKKCLRCNAENKDEAIFCRSCGNTFISAGVYRSDIKGSSVNPAARISSSYLLSAVIAAVFFIFGAALSAADFFLVKNHMIKDFPGLVKAIKQLILKISYVAEGTSVGYISSEIRSICSYSLYGVFTVIALILFVVSIAGIIYGIININAKARNKKSVTAPRVFGMILKISGIIIAVLLILCLILFAVSKIV